MTRQRRQSEIIELLAAKGEMTVDELAGRFRVSEMTIRRDLARLARSGRLSRTHGGAVLSLAGTVSFEFQHRQARNIELKRRIARAVAERIEPGTTLLLDTGSTTLEVARAVAAVPRLTVLTTSLMIASVLHTRENVELILLGGAVRRGSPDLSGPLTEENLRRFRVDAAVLGGDGATRDGVFTASLEVARVAHAIVEAAERSFLAVDHTKFETPAFVKYADWSDFRHVVTDNGIGPEVRAWLDRTGIDVVVVGEKDDST